MDGRTEYRALDRRVLAIAVEGAVGDWAAYIGAVPGDNHEREYHLIMSNGTKLPENVAKLLFPGWVRMRWRP